MSTHVNDLASAAVVAAGYPPTVITETEVGSAVDLAQGDGACFAVQLVGAVSSGDSVTGAIEESADNDTWAAVSGGTFTTATATGVQTIRFERTRRYVRWVGTVAGTDPSIAVAVVIGQEKKLY